MWVNPPCCDTSPFEKWLFLLTSLFCELTSVFHSQSSYSDTSSKRLSVTTRLLSTLSFKPMSGDTSSSRKRQSSTLNWKRLKRNQRLKEPLKMRPKPPRPTMRRKTTSPIDSERSSESWSTWKQKPARLELDSCLQVLVSPMPIRKCRRDLSLVVGVCDWPLREHCLSSLM